MLGKFKQVIRKSVSSKVRIKVIIHKNQESLKLEFNLKFLLLMLT